MFIYNPDPHSPVEKYLQYGSMTPPMSTISYCIDAIEKDHGEKSLVLADVLIDAATQDPPNANSHLAAAEELLHDILDQTNFLVDNDLEGDALARSAVTVASGLRIIDLENYKSLAANGTTSNNYPGIVSTVSALATYPLSSHAEDRLREYFPVLLASRNAYRSDMEAPSSAVGRLALSREDQLPLCAPGINPRWDCGLVLQEGETSFLEPSKKLQVKVGKRRHITLYGLAGISCISLKQLGLDDTFDVLDRCSDELGQPMIYEDAPLSSHELDIRVAKLFTYVK